MYERDRTTPRHRQNHTQITGRSKSRSRSQRPSFPAVASMGLSPSNASTRVHWVSGQVVSGHAQANASCHHSCHRYPDCLRFPRSHCERHGITYNGAAFVSSSSDVCSVSTLTFQARIRTWGVNLFPTDRVSNVSDRLQSK